MATINLGNLTFTHKGDYAGGTAYVKNDVVYYATNGNSYIAKTSTTGNAPTSTAHWDLFVAGASGIFSGGLSLGSANQVVAVNSSANALEFQDASGGAWEKLGQVVHTGSSVSAVDVDFTPNDSVYAWYKLYITNLYGWLLALKSNIGIFHTTSSANIIATNTNISALAISPKTRLVI